MGWATIRRRQLAGTERGDSGTGPGTEHADSSSLSLLIGGERNRYSSQFENNYFTSMCSGSEAGLYSRIIDFCTTQL